MSFLYVQAYHGRSSSFASYRHKPQFLSGLKDRLQKLGFRVDLVPVEHKNYCVLEMCGYEVFRCQLENLHFNTCHDRDIVCNRAIDAVMQASVKFRRARAYLWFWTLIDHELHKRSKLSAKDFWPDVHYNYEESVDKCKECLTCCDVPPERRDCTGLFSYSA